MRATAGLPAYLVVLSAVASVAASGAPAGVPPGVTAPVRVTPETGAALRTYAPAALAADPDEPVRLYGAGVELRSRRCTFHRSADGGRTWTKAASPSPAGYPFCSHAAPFMPMAALSLGRDETIYYLHRGWSHQDEGPAPNSSILLSRSDDDGDTWRTAVVRGTRETRSPDNEVAYPTDVVVDTNGSENVVYVSWTTTYPSSAPRKPNQPFLSVSSDGGATFSAPTSVAGSFFDDPDHLTGDIPAPLKKKEHFGGALPYLALDDRGGLSVTWVRRTANVGIQAEPRYLSRSTDRGRTFSVTELAPASPLNNGGAELAWTSSGTASGVLHAVYEDKAGANQGDRDVHYRRSEDGGRTWSEPTVINDDEPAELFSQLLPTIAAAPDGRLDVTWWDTRHALEHYATDVYYASSADAGTTWSKNVRVSPRSVSRRFGSWVDNFGNTRQPPALATGAEAATILWDDTRNGAPSSPIQDLYASSVQYEPLPAGGTSSAPAYLGAAGAGGLVGLVVTWLGRRRRGRTQPGVEEAGA